MPEHVNEADARARFCAELPVLHDRARQLGRQDELRQLISDLRAGESAVAAWNLAKETLYPATETRSVDPELYGRRMRRFPVPDPTFRDVLPASTSVTGHYACPHQTCSRVGDRDARNRPPTCAITGDPMRFVQDQGAAR